MAMSAADAVDRAAVPVRGQPDDYDVLLDLVGDARFVLMGEASHGSHELYRERARITRALIEEKGFAAVAVEADWPDAFRAGCWARGASTDATPEEALSGFRRFPAWMWRNTEVVRFLSWLRSHNDGRRPVGFYGLDLYSLFSSMEAVVDALDQVDPAAAARARSAYACFDQFGEDAQAYG